MYTIEEAISIARSHEASGRFVEALIIYRNIASADKGNFEAITKVKDIESRFANLLGAMSAFFPGENIPFRMLNNIPELSFLVKSLRAEQVVPTLAIAPAGSPGQPTGRLLDVVSSALPFARGIGLPTLDARTSGEERLYRVWPGEHYALIAAIVKTVRPRLVIEFGTFTGMCTLAMADHIPDHGRVVTFDVTPWNRITNTWFREDDFRTGRISQELADLAQPHVFEQYRGLLAQADIIFLDGPKDVVTERAVLAHMATVEFARPPLVIVDDIKWPHMIEIWHTLDRPKMDVTSFGHWCGTGLVDWV